MKRNFTQLMLSLLLVFGAILSVQAQGQKTIDFSGDDYCNHVVQIGNAYYIVGSTSAAGGGSYDAYIAKLDSLGNPVWQKQYGGSGVEFGTYLTATSDNNLLMVGRSNSYGTNYDMFVVKTDLSGNVLWSKTIGTDTTDYGMRVAEGPTGYLIVGQTLGVPTSINGKTDILVALVDASGNLKWSKNIGVPYANETPYETLSLGSDGFIIAGSTGVNLIGLGEALFFAIDTTGQIQGAFITGGEGEDDFRSIIGAGDGLYVVGNTNTVTGGGNANFLVARFNFVNQMPVLQWIKNYGGPQQESMNSAQMLPDGRIIMFGLTSSFGANGDGIAIVVDSNGVAQMAKHYGGSADDYISSAAFGNNGALFVGNSGSFGASAENVYLVMPDQTGSSGCNDDTAAIVTTVMADTAIGPVIPDFVSDSIHVNAVTRTPAAGSNVGTVANLCPTGITPVTAQLEFTMFPNPTAGNTELVFYTDKSSATVVSICNALGQTISQFNRDSFTGRNSVTLNTAGYSPGIYFVKVKTNDAQGVMPLCVR